MGFVMGFVIFSGISWYSVTCKLAIWFEKRFYESLYFGMNTT